MSVSNNGDYDNGIRWLLALFGDDPLKTFDTYHRFFEGLNKTWPVMRRISGEFGVDIHPIARFVAERIKAAGDELISFNWIDSPVTTAVVLADRSHDITAFFSIGLKPNGSKDPFALRRAAKHFIIASALIPNLES